MAEKEQNENDAVELPIAKELPKQKTIFVRILQNYSACRPGDLAAIGADDAASLVAAGIADDNAEAVDYAKKTSANKVDLTQK